MDEPLSNLDAKLRVQTRAELAELQARLAVTTVYVTHDQVEAMTMGHRVAVLRDGLLQQCDTPHALYHQPGQPVRGRLHRLAGDEPRQCVPAASRSSLPAHPSSSRRKPITRVAAFGGDRVTIGFRPESIRGSDRAASTASSASSRTSGPEVFVHVAIQHDGARRSRWWPRRRRRCRGGRSTDDGDGARRGAHLRSNGAPAGNLERVPRHGTGVMPPGDRGSRSSRGRPVTSGEPRRGCSPSGLGPRPDRARTDRRRAGQHVAEYRALAQTCGVTPPTSQTSEPWRPSSSSASRTSACRSGCSTTPACRDSSSGSTATPSPKPAPSSRSTSSARSRCCRW